MKITTKITKAFAAAAAVITMATATVNLTASATQIRTDGIGGVYCTAYNSDIDLYDGYSIIDGSFENDQKFKISFKYSDSLFSTDPFEYNPHMATLSVAMAEASATYQDENDKTEQCDYTTIGGGVILNRWGNTYFHSAKRIASVLKQCKFQNIEVSESYTVKPTADSIACAFGTKEIQTENGSRTVVSITVRSASYESEWASNMTLGTEGEAKGFADSANQVITYLNDYMNAHTEIRKAADKGECYFWVQGFSRGGAVANLTAKRLIDSYQAIGDRVYAYTFEAPKGGVMNEMHSDCDYSCIHNIINKNDLVTYVAPGELGFMRYGTTHLVNDTEASRVKEELKKFMSEEMANEYVPADMCGIKLKLFPTTTLVTDPSFRGSDCIEKLIGALCYNKDREYYARNIEGRLRRMMEWVNEDYDPGTAFGTISWVSVAARADAAVAKNAVVDTAKMVWDNFLFIFTGHTASAVVDIAKNKYYENFGEEALTETLVNALRDHLNANESFQKRMCLYHGGAKAAIDDITALAKMVLETNSYDLNDLITLGAGIGNIAKNHSIVQTYATMRVNDSWFNA